MNIHPALIIIPIVVAVDGLVLWAVFSGLRREWNELEVRFPRVPIVGLSVRKDFQSLRLGIFNLGMSVHLTADERFLHLHPAQLMRVIGLRDCSVPWESITVLKRGRWNTKAKIASSHVHGPTWAFEMGSGAASHPDAQRNPHADNNPDNNAPRPGVD